MTTTDVTWAKIADELTRTQRDLLAKLKIEPPKKIIEATPAAAP